MALEINKPSVWIPIVLVAIGMVAGMITGAFAVFLTKEAYAAFQKHIHEKWLLEKTELLVKIADTQKEIAGVSINQQYNWAKQEVKDLERDLRNFKKKYGNPPYSDPDVQARYDDLIQALKDERAYRDKLRDKVKK